MKKRLNLCRCLPKNPTHVFTMIHYVEQGGLSPEIVSKVGQFVSLNTEHPDENFPVPFGNILIGTQDAKNRKPIISNYLSKSRHVCEGFVMYFSVVTITLGILGIPPEVGLTLGTFPASPG